LRPSPGFKIILSVLVQFFTGFLWILEIVLAREKRNEMQTTSKVLLASALVLSFAAPVMAAESEDSGGMIYKFSNGKMYKAHVNIDMHGMMRHFRRLPSGTLIYSDGGRYYIAQDRRMSNGEMMSDVIFGDAAARGNSH
jgi:hypothetical protein